LCRNVHSRLSVVDVVGKKTGSCTKKKEGPHACDAKRGEGKLFALGGHGILWEKKKKAGSLTAWGRVRGSGGEGGSHMLKGLAAQKRSRQKEGRKL